MNKIYILGAGASIGAQRFPVKYFSQDRMMPSGQNFFADIFENPNASKDGLDFFNILDFLAEGLSKMIQQAWKMNQEVQFWDKKEWKNINIEDVFTFIDLGCNLYPKNSRYKKFFKSCRESLIQFIFIALSMRTLGQRCEHLVKLFENINNTDNIISFNWDTIADTTLEYLNNEQFHNYISLFDNNKTYYKKYIKKGLYLKLHGSLNWMICNNKNCSGYKIVKLIKSPIDTSIQNLRLSDFDKCPLCGDKIEIYIIPPTSNKIDIYKNPFIAKQWLLVREKFRFTDKLIFIGYSFPSTDFYSEWLFRQINFLIDTKNKFHIYDIDVVNPECINKRSLTYKKYSNIFKKHNIKYFKDLKTYVNLMNKL